MVCTNPFFSGSRGLTGKEHYQNEFVSVRDGRISKDDFEQQSDYPPLVTDGTGHSILDKLSCAKFTEELPGDFKLRVSCQRKLTSRSLADMLAYIELERMKAR